MGEESVDVAPFLGPASHVSKWVFTKDELQRRRAAANQDACGRTNEAIDHDRKLRQQRDQGERLAVSLEEELMLTSYYSHRLLSLCDHKKYSFRVKTTSTMFFKRFFVNRSCIDYDPLQILVVCIVLAHKVEELHDEDLKALIHGLKVPLKVIVDLEIEVLEALDFELLVTHPRFAIREMVDDYHTWCGEHAVPQLQKEDALQLVEGAEGLALQLYETDIPLLCTPAHIAVVSVKITAENNKLDLSDKFIEECFASRGVELAAVEQKVKFIRDAAASIKRHGTDSPEATKEQEAAAKIFKRCQSCRKAIKRLRHHKEQSAESVKAGGVKTEGDNGSEKKGKRDKKEKKRKHGDVALGGDATDDVKRLKIEDDRPQPSPSDG
ncbi:unnamed protein product [Vitrella brassicaformis CCMP3155]|uniref:Cyclin-like domain-containing protein n=2 Tax=Vitrella brassicaformis TaxID=1169539 RepID=A0A0G4FP58_VITBC|nr:unnamed protein product [Vitrella brassicaformis CCMP3155]|mmetsp:Transcript_26170/g.65059  ORF Transcript_26170/g.65059 Transcript_26170/m.65059 type:complete len:381 (+) Transcript_26170:27-1169(+)|eukprot:CEM16022.1 unnamed protein product [Vitrella brassicaformis CCMP3155]